MRCCSTASRRDSALLAEHLQGASRDAVRLFGERAGDVAWDRTALNALIKQIVGELKLKMPQVAVPLRVAVTGQTQTPSIDAVLELIGRETTRARIAAALDAHLTAGLLRWPGRNYRPGAHRLHRRADSPRLASRR